MRNQKCIYECQMEAQIPQGNYKGIWSGNTINFQVKMMQEDKEVLQPCAINASEEHKDLPVMVVVWGPYIYIYKQSDVKA